MTLPQAALDWFTTLSKYDMQKDHELATHDNLSVVACEMLFEHLPHSSIEQRKIWLDAIHRWLSRFAAVPNRSESAWELFEQLTRINRQRIDLIRIGLNRLELTVIDRTAGHVDDL